MKALDIQNLKKTYPNDVVALKEVSFSVKAGDFFALLGPNGAGKSTIIGILTSLVRKTSGQVKIFEYDVDKDFSTAKSFIGVVPQEFNMSIFDTVMNTVLYQAGYYGLPRKIAFERSSYYLHKLALWEKRHAAIVSLSGGMKRRLMIARALVHQPRMLILDEPTAGVDIEIRRFLWQFLSELNSQGITIILTTHYLEEAENLCRNIAIIDKGEIITNTSMAAILRQLNKERFILYLKEPYKSLPNLPDYTIFSQDSMTLEVEVPDQHDLSFLFEKLKQHSITVVSMRNKSNRLEELFVKLTMKQNQ